MMKNIILIIFLLLVTQLYSQEPQPHFILDEVIVSNETKDYIARDYVNMVTGHNSNPDVSKHVLADIDPLLVFPPADGDLTGGDPVNNNGGVVGTLPGNLMVSPSGAAIYNIPIELPAGVAGMTPSLNLVYNSQKGDGFFGVGWALSGLSEITRTTTTIYNNGYIDGVDFDDNDQFMLDGQRLIPVNTEKTEYRTENESFSKIVVREKDEFGPIWFEVYTKNNLILEFGKTNDSRVTHSNKDGVLSWCINRIMDRSGNYIDYTYYSANTNGYNFPLNITYGGNEINGQLPFYEIEFEYITKAYEPLNWTYGWYHVDHKLLINQINLKYLETENVVRKWIMSYEHGIYSRLKSITPEGSDGTVLNPTMFQWGNDDHTPVNETVNYNYTDRDKLFLDYNGDGKTDMVELHVEIDGNNKKKYTGWNYRKRLETGFSGASNINSVIDHYVHSFAKGDYNGDGLDDIVRFSYTNSDLTEIIMDMVLFSNGDGFVCHNISGFQFMKSFHPEIRTGDFNGDCIDEIIVSQKSWDISGASNNTHVLKFSTTSPYYHLHMGSRLDFGNKDVEYSQLHLGDFNGDGSNEVMTVSRTEESARGSQVDRSIIYDIDLINHTTEVYFENVDYPTINHRVFTGDFSGDGITDILTYDVPDPAKSWVVSRFNGKDKWIFYWPDPDLYDVDPYGVSNGNIHTYWYSFRVADYNGDGKSDIAQYHLRESQDIADFDIFYSTGGRYFQKFSGEISVNGGFVTTGTNNIIYNNLSSYNDFNGDGRADDYFNNGFVNDEIYLFDCNNDYTELKGIINGFGHKTEISYNRLTNNDVYTKGSGADYPLRDIQPPINVVETVEVENGQSGKITTNYRYSGAKMHCQGKGFLGFEKTIIIQNPDSDHTLTTENTNMFNETYFFRWMYSSKNYADIEGSNNELISEVINDNPVIKDFGNNRIFQYIPRSLTKYHHTGDETSSYIKTTLIEQSYSDADILFGNLTSSVLYSDPDEHSLSDPVDEYDFFSKKSFKYHAPFTNIWLTGLVEESVTETWSKDVGVMDKHKSIFKYYYQTPRIYSIEQIPNNDSELSTLLTYDNYDDYGNITSSTISAPNFTPATASRNTLYSYNPEYCGRFLTETKKVIDGAEYITSSTYYGETGLVSSSTDINELTTSYYYDGFGRLEKTVAPNGVQQVNKLFWAHDHEDNPENGLYYAWSQRSGESASCSFFNKTRQDLLSMSDDFKGRKVYQKNSYDELGRLKQTSNLHYSEPDLLWSYYSYTSTGLIKKLVSPTATINKQYDGRITTSVNQTINRQTSEETNAIGNIIKVSDEGGIIDYEYYSSGKHSSITSNGTSIGYIYDALGNIETLKDPDAGTITYDYNPFGEIIKQTNGNGMTYEMEYDGLGRLVTKNLLGSIDDKVTCTYYTNRVNGYGQLQSITKANGIQTNYLYDEYARVIEKAQTVDNNTYQFNYEYNILGKIDTKYWPSGFAVNYHYKNGYLSGVEQSNTGTILWDLEDVNAQGQVLQYRLGNGLLTEKVFDSYGFPVSITTDNQVQTLNYSFNPNTGNLIWRESAVYPPYGNHMLREDFTYDLTTLNNRLESWKVGNGTTYENLYQANGNIESKSDVGTYMYDNIEEGPHAVSRIKNPNTTYLDNTKNREQVITYTGFDKTNTITILDENDPEVSSHMEFTYGPDQARRKTVLYKNNEMVQTKYFIGNSLEIEKDKDNNTRELHYINAGDGLLAIYEIDSRGSGSMYYVHKDYLGSLESITNQEGEVIEKLSFDPWGRRRNATNWTYDNLPDSYLFSRGFTGHEHLDEFDLVNMNGRTYDPVLGRFLSPDNYVQAPYYTQSFNRYSYVFNNPFKYTDPSGENPILGIAAIAIFTYLQNAYVNRDENGKWSWNPGDWFKDGNFQVQAGINSSLDMSDVTYFGTAGPGNFNPGISYNTNKGTGIGYFYNGNTSFYYPNHDYNRPEQNAEASIDRTIQDHSADWHAASSSNSGNGKLWTSTLVFAATASACDGPLPFGEIVGVASIAAVGSYSGAKAIVDYYQTRGIQYTLRARSPGYYPVFSWGSRNPTGYQYLNTGDVWKIGQTTRYDPMSGRQYRYSQTQLDYWGVEFVPEFPGSRLQILTVEKMKIWNYIHIYDELPPGNKVPW